MRKKDSPIQTEDSDEFISASNKQVELLDSVIEIIRTRYRGLSPERQYLLSAIVLWLYLSILIQPDSMPERVKPMIAFFNQMPQAELSWWLGSMAAFAGTADGARRIVIDQLPFYKACINAFVFRRRFLE